MMQVANLSPESVTKFKEASLSYAYDQFQNLDKLMDSF